jgi:5-methylcytosine-specific restriction endonuclease McrA
MFKFLSKIWHQVITDDKLATPRSSRWPAARKAWLILHPACAICGCLDNVAVHHKVPVHIDPSLELDQTNFITLGESCPTGNHHLLYGHLGRWASFNSTVEEDAFYWRAKILNRP